VDEFEIAVDGATLAVSRTPGDRLELIALHGSTPGTRDGPLYRHLHDVLPPTGIGVVTFDRRGEGDSTGRSSLGNFELQARDCVSIMDALGDSRFGIWGFSQGGWVAPIVAGRRAADVVCVVTIGASGVTPPEQMRYGVARHLADAGYDASTMLRVDALWVQAMRVLRGDGSLDDLQAQLHDAAREPWWPFAFLPEEIPNGEARIAVLREMDHDPLPSFRSVRCPVLAIYGERDEWVPVDVSVAAWQAAQGQNVTTVVLEGGSHDPLDGDALVAEQYERLLVGWLGELVGVSRS
jgi:pimeloyl-ACP methyl ester carboxylesterase